LGSGGVSSRGAVSGNPRAGAGAGGAARARQQQSLEIGRLTVLSREAGSHEARALATNRLDDARRSPDRSAWEGTPSRRRGWSSSRRCDCGSCSASLACGHRRRSMPDSGRVLTRAASGRFDRAALEINGRVRRAASHRTVAQARARDPRPVSTAPQRSNEDDDDR